MKNAAKLSVFIGVLLALAVAGGVDGGMSAAATAWGCAAAIALMTVGTAYLSHEGRRGA